MLREIRRRFALLSPAERLRWASMAPLGLASAALEGAGGALVFALLTSSLDPATERDVAQALDEVREGRTVIVIAHRLTTVERCDRVLLLSGGRIEAAGSYAELATANAAFRALAALG